MWTKIQSHRKTIKENTNERKRKDLASYREVEHASSSEVIKAWETSAAMLVQEAHLMYVTRVSAFD